MPISPKGSTDIETRIGVAKNIKKHKFLKKALIKNAIRNLLMIKDRILSNHMLTPLQHVQRTKQLKKRGNS